MTTKTRSISAQEAFETLTIKFKDESDGTIVRYVSKLLTRSKRKKFAEAKDQIDGLENLELPDDELDKKAIEITAEMIGLCVEPVDGAPEDVAAYIVEKWEDDLLADAYIERVLMEVSLAVGPFSGMSNRSPQS